MVGTAVSHTREGAMNRKSGRCGFAKLAAGTLLLALSADLASAAPAQVPQQHQPAARPRHQLRCHRHRSGRQRRRHQRVRGRMVHRALARRIGYMIASNLEPGPAPVRRRPRSYYAEPRPLVYGPPYPYVLWAPLSTTGRATAIGGGGEEPCSQLAKGAKSGRRSAAGAFPRIVRCQCAIDWWPVM